MITGRRLAATLILSGITVATLGGCAGMSGPARKTVATATLLRADGGVAGNAVLSAVGDRIDLRLEVSGFAPGIHGAHLHAVGKCEPSSFASAGGHLNPHGRQHGTMNPNGSHLGDLPNLSVDATGAGSFEVALSGGAGEIETALFDADGTAVVVHAAPDDYVTDPSGNSGARIACGVFARTR